MTPSHGRQTRFLPFVLVGTAAVARPQVANDQKEPLLHLGFWGGDSEFGSALRLSAAGPSAFRVVFAKAKPNHPPQKASPNLEPPIGSLPSLALAARGSHFSARCLKSALPGEGYSDQEEDSMTRGEEIG